MSVDRAKMGAQLVLHEGLKLQQYQDTKGYWTLGVGYNVSARGLGFFEQTIKRKLLTSSVITRYEALLVLRADIDRIEALMPAYFPGYANLSEVRQRVCLDLAFNLGFRALAFLKTIAAINAKDWSLASRELFKSKWANDVGPGRAGRLTQMLLTGADYHA